jgi:hypothetical protein
LEGNAANIQDDAAGLYRQELAMEEMEPKREYGVATQVVLT